MNAWEDGPEPEDMIDLCDECDFCGAEIEQGKGFCSRSCARAFENDGPSEEDGQ